ncbi:vWA domain-containing protein [Tropicimonas sp. S265A]|uniref:vWA domain-containing protein n=1 Tax=Tropicimonas sp. S265A TaxID=3415134 RepID=UPI003C7A39D3
MIRHLRAILALALAFGVLVAAGPSLAQTQRPLLLEGTQTVYQRVLTKPSALLRSAPNGPVQDELPAFQPLYVYAAQGPWLAVGNSNAGGPMGWVAAEETVEWRQNIVGAFTNRAARERQFFFDSEDQLRWLMNHEALRQVQERLLAQAEAGIIDGAEGIVAIEPEEFVNIREELYLMPILDFVEDLHPVNYEDVLLMQIASVPKEAARPAAPEDTGKGGEFDVGIVFVLDTTQSMEPYIAATQEVLQNTVRDISGTEIGNLVNFGAVGFRDSTDAVPDLEYRTKTLLPLTRRQDQTPVIAAIATTEVARANSPGFNEDSLAGVEDAIDQIDWDQLGVGDPIDARYVILVTDAGPKDPRDPNARSEIGVAELQADAEGRNIVVMTLHLKTSAGQGGNHAYAADRYRTLSRFAGREYYFPIEGGSRDAFADTAQRLVTALTDHVRVARGEESVLPDSEAGEDLLALGRAMRLAYLGATRGTQAPSVIEGWVSDKAVESPRETVIEPRLLVTKNELATMAELLDNLVRLGEQSRDSQDAYSFFGQVRGVIADMAQNPDRLVNPDTETLGGALEYLERLPYQSQLLQMTEDRWGQSAMLRRSVIDGMRQKLTQYRKWLFDPSVWTALYEGAPDGELVYAMPFDVLP